MTKRKRKGEWGVSLDRLTHGGSLYLVAFLMRRGGATHRDTVMAEVDRVELGTNITNYEKTIKTDRVKALEKTFTECWQQYARELGIEVEPLLD